jgi:putative transposase
VATEEDLVKRDFAADWPDALWLTDITEHPTREGKLYCAVVMAAFSRHITGWSIAARQDSDLVINALSIAVARRQPEKGRTVLHSDHGAQGGFNRSSQHLDEEVGNGVFAASEGSSCLPGADPVAGQADGGMA